MKKFKIPIIIGLVFIILVVVNLRFDLIDRIIVQFSSEKYAEYVSEMESAFGKGKCHVLNIRKYGGIKVF